CQAALDALVGSPPAADAAGRILQATSRVHLQSASRAGQAAVAAIGSLFGRPEVEQRCHRLAADVADSGSYERDLELIQACLTDLTRWPEPAEGSLLAMARASVTPSGTAVGQRGDGVVVGGVRLKVKRRAWEQEAPREAGAQSA
ncbi:MAG: hypothetical protein AB1758_01780, partial [Candidatus Eremiobacterota bacterium]